MNAGFRASCERSVKVVLNVFELFIIYLFISADPKFIAAHLIPDNNDRDDDKVYFFFTEKASEAGDREGAIHTRVGRVCAVRYFRMLSLLVNDDVSGN